jgi:O-antigen/teichoic acid export membrane protein
MKLLHRAFDRGKVSTALNFSLRLTSLGGKMMLSLYMARFFGLSDLGVYGLAFGCVMIAVAVFGVRLDYILSREIAGFDPERASASFGTISVFYLANFAIGIWLAAVFCSGSINAPRGALLLILVLCCLESYANLLFNLIISLGRSTLANALFFVRAGLWTAPAILLSWLYPHLRSAEFILMCWVVGSAASIVLSLPFLYRRGVRFRLDPQFIKSWLGPSLGQVFMVWVGSVATTVGSYLDRFILAHYMPLEQVGVATFYLSFTTPILTLIQSSTVAVNYPQLITLHDAGDEAGYYREFYRLAFLAAALSGGILLMLGLAIPGFAFVTHKAELLANVPGLALLLFATLLRTHAESAYYLLFIERRHTAIWSGNILFLLASWGLNVLLIPRYGVLGLGVAAVISVLILLAWRLWFARRRKGLWAAQAASPAVRPPSPVDWDGSLAEDSAPN